MTGLYLIQHLGDRTVTCDEEHSKNDQPDQFANIDFVCMVPR